MSRTSGNDPRVIKLVDALQYELVKQRSGADAIPRGSRGQARPGGLADAERCACRHDDLPCSYEKCSAYVARKRYSPLKVRLPWATAASTCVQADHVPKQQV